MAGNGWKWLKIPDMAGMAINCNANNEENLKNNCEESKGVAQSQFGLCLMVFAEQW